MQIVYFTRSNRRQPVKEWREEQPKDTRANIDAKIGKLAQYGLGLLGTEMLDRIAGEDADLYELRNVGKKWRIAVYLDRDIDTFVLLHGWKKQKQTQPHDIEQARRHLREYLSLKKGQRL